MSDKTTTVITFAERHTCTYGMDLTQTDTSTEYEDIECELEPDLTPHDDWLDDEPEPCIRCWKSHRRTQCHNPEPSPKKEKP